MTTAELIGAALTALGGVGVAFFAYRRGQRADDAAAENTATAQVYQGYGGLLERIQADNIDLRKRLAAAEARIASLLESYQRALALLAADRDAASTRADVGRLFEELRIAEESNGVDK